MNINSPQGATWRKWDLHIHTPSSIVQHYGGDTSEVWGKFIEKLENLPENVKAIGINDYYFIDGYEKIIKEKLAGNLKNIEKVFPIIEFRIDTFASATGSKFSKINLHVLFDIDENNISSEVKRIKEEFIGQIHLSKLHSTIPLTKENLIKHSAEGTLQDGFSQIIPSTEEIIKLINSEYWKDKVIVFLGYNEWNNLDKGKQLKQFKDDLYSKADAFFTASNNDINTKKTEVLEKYGNKIFLHSLDIHKFEVFDSYNCSTWIKADPTFKGLKQALIENNNRIFIGTSPARLLYQNDNKDLFVESIRFKSKTSKCGWFDEVPTLPLNSGLVAIIGDKGNGKSALADSIALAGNSQNANFSFLTRTKFLSSLAHKNYSAIIKYCDGYENTVHFSDPTPNSAEKERVKYLSQSFVTDLCDEIDGSDKLQSEIDRVIFSHIPTEKKLGKDTLLELIVSRTTNFDTKVNEKFSEIREVNTEIVKVEEKVSDYNKTKLDTLLEELTRKLAEHEKNEPVKPISNRDDDYKLKLVEKYSTKLTEVESLIETKQTSNGLDEIIVHEVTGHIETLDDIVTRRDEFILNMSQSKTISDNNIDPKELITIKTNKAPLESLVGTKKENIDSRNKFIKRAKTFLLSVQTRINNMQAGLSSNQEIQHTYVSNIRKWTKEKKKIIGTKKDKDSINWCKAELKKITDTYPTTLTELYKKRKIIMEKIIQCTFEKEKNIKDIYSYVQNKARDIANTLEVGQDEFIEFTPKITISENFKSQFFSYITQNKTGTFYGSAEGNDQLDKLIPLESEMTKDVILRFPDNIVKALNHNIASDPDNKNKKYKTNLNDQLKSNKEKLDLYNYLFSYEYLDAKFTITYNEKSVSKLSPGEKGILLLAFYLLIDDSKLPIIIDQPEENIGNKTIFERLVNFIKIAKQTRQILIVTHSANLAIVCDADQILYSKMDKTAKNKLSYQSGSIEFDPIKGHSIDILEGTKVAFDNRRAKYEI